MSGEPQTRVTPRFRTWLWQAVAVTTLLLSLIVARCLLSARSEWEGGQRALKDGKASLAITYYRRSASWHVPLSPYTERALEMLAHLSRREAERGRQEAARLSTLAQLSAQHAARNFTQPLPTDPSPPFTLFALLGWLSWSAASLLLVTRGLDSEGQLLPIAPRLMLTIVLGMGAFALGLAFA